MVTDQVSLVEDRLVRAEERKLSTTVGTGAYVEYLAVHFRISVIAVGPTLTAERCQGYGLVKWKLSMAIFYKHCSYEQ